MSSLVAFIIGAGKNIGEHTAAALKAKGYQVAPRLPQTYVESPETVKTAFSQVTKELGPPNVVIFNGEDLILSPATFVPSPVAEHPLSLSLEAFKQHTDVGLAVYAAAQEALAGFRSGTHKDAVKTFIVTGNPLPWIPGNRPGRIGLNVEKTLKWRLIEILSGAYSKEGIRFHYVSLVGEDGGVIDPVSKFFTSGPQHAQVYLDLITRKDPADWDYRFTLDGKQWTK
ncbi:hypothetical protein MSAN_01770100 [Mycena sanguinolenta]|uniref:NAD(P)-binding domain-containing protein n=1 Tax=Mycena sanguinolenta TaxID=230812 RepID=A0A8H6XXL4_9AGAR|nr:hypothetical protein MSAN_01770100 [Mycena sanguinolenta]